MYPTDNEQSLLEIELGLDQEPASKGQRFANYLVDVIAFYIVVVVIGVIWAVINPRQAVIYADEASNSTFLSYVFIYASYVIFYTIIEGASGGRTLGKLITKTKVTNEDGASIRWKDAFLRSLCRLVPFEPLSALGESPWHDKWTQTKVVKVIK